MKKLEEMGGTTYKVHLDGHDQTAMLTDKGPSKREEIWYVGESTLGAARSGGAGSPRSVTRGA